jgi:hypothetical protein
MDPITYAAASAGTQTGAAAIAISSGDRAKSVNPVEKRYGWSRTDDRDDRPPYFLTAGLLDGYGGSAGPGRTRRAHVDYDGDVAADWAWPGSADCLHDPDTCGGRAGVLHVSRYATDGRDHSGHGFLKTRNIQE